MKSPLKSKKPWQKMHFSCFLWDYFHGGIRFGIGFLVQERPAFAARALFFRQDRTRFAAKPGVGGSDFWGKTGRDKARCKSAGYEVRFFSARRLSFFAFFVAICYNAVVAGLPFCCGPRFRTVCLFRKRSDSVHYFTSTRSGLFGFPGKASACCQ